MSQRLCVVSGSLCVLLGIASFATAEDLSEKDLLESFSKVSVLHAELKVHALHPGSEVTVRGQMLMVNDGGTIQFHVPTMAEFKDQPHRNAEVEYLYAGNVLHTAASDSGTTRVQRSTFDMNFIVPPGGLEMFEWLQERYAVTFEASESGGDEPKSLIRVRGTRRPEMEKKAQFGEFEGVFDAETGLLHRFEWSEWTSAGGQGGVTIEYSDYDLNPDWDPNRLIFEPAPDAIVGDLHIHE